MSPIFTQDGHKSLHTKVLFRRLGAALIDGAIEFSGGVLGSYFGAMVAALLIALRDESAEYLQHSMWSGVGFGFVFWTFSISFINRVLIQGLSRASIGKKLFKLEMISTRHNLTWTTMISRWVLSYVSFAFGGLGYLFMLFDREGRAVHDMIMHTDVTPILKSGIMSVEYSEEVQESQPVFTAQPLSNVIVLSNPSAERPTAQVIRLPLQEEKPRIAYSPIRSQLTLAQVIRITPIDEHADHEKSANKAESNDHSGSDTATGSGKKAA